MNFYLIEIYTAAMREVARAPEDERQARTARLEQMWKAMKQPERALAEVSIGIRGVR